jgi:hypothetical protein
MASTYPRPLYEIDNEVVDPYMKLPPSSVYEVPAVASQPAEKTTVSRFARRVHGWSWQAVRANQRHRSLRLPSKVV